VFQINIKEKKNEKEYVLMENLFEERFCPIHHIDDARTNESRNCIGFG